MQTGLAVAVSCVFVVAFIQTSEFNVPCNVSNDFPEHVFNFSKINKSGKYFNTTIVTALYDINRGDRSFQEYKNWFKATLKISLPMIVFCKRENTAWMRKARGDRPIVIVEEEHIPLEYLVNRSAKIVPRMQRGRQNVEWINERYMAVQYSKAIWLKHGMRSNPFDSQIFFWLDAGASRFFTGGQPNAPFAMLQNQNMVPDKLYGSATSYLSLLKHMDEDDIIGSKIAFIVGTAFGGHIFAVKRACDTLLLILHKDMLDKCSIDNEQVALGLMYKAHPDWFQLLDTKHCSWACL